MEKRNKYVILQLTHIMVSHKVKEAILTYCYSHQLNLVPLVCTDDP